MRETDSRTGKPTRPKDRRADALRANLRRRKLQARGRAAASAEPAEEPSPASQTGDPRRDET